ncbi:Uma2 family endonuclease [Calothrix sp. CCY 0018]|uniref:Uma2 family endonuclease n=1 Tax=Calothrix sp. CCY 0018 TaxID=3103864 RepID=UPI0039C6EADA
MTQTLPKILTETLITFEDFVKLETGDKRYELHNGILVEVAQPIGEHENVTGFLIRKLLAKFENFDLPYFIAPKVLIKPIGKNSGFLPDVLVLDKRNLANEPLYRKESTVSQSATVPLVVEVVSTNWQDDYALKFDEYSDIGIPEYWIVDYLGLGGKEFIGSPKKPTFTLCELVNGQYVRTPLTSGAIQSKVFPELNLTVEQIFDAAKF